MTTPEHVDPGEERVSELGTLPPSWENLREAVDILGRIHGVSFTWEVRPSNCVEIRMRGRSVLVAIDETGYRVGCWQDSMDLELRPFPNTERVAWYAIAKKDIVGWEQRALAARMKKDGRTVIPLPEFGEYLRKALRGPDSG